MSSPYVEDAMITPSVAAKARKRSIDDVIGTTRATKMYTSPDDFTEMCRSDRKRHREKRRRGQVNAGFDDLKDLLLQIDPDTCDKGGEINRVDLIGRAVVVMKDMNEENERLKKQVLNREQGSTNQVTFAMPFMVPNHSGAVMNAMHSSPHQQMPQHHVPQHSTPAQHMPHQHHFYNGRGSYQI